jgi:hypothetical protein
MKTSLASHLKFNANSSHNPKSEIIRTEFIEVRQRKSYLPMFYGDVIPDFFTYRSGHELGGTSTITWLSNVFLQMGALYTSGFIPQIERPGSIELKDAFDNSDIEVLEFDFEINDPSFLITQHQVAQNFFHFLIDSLPGFRFKELSARSSSPFLFSPWRTPFQAEVMDLLLSKRHPIYDVSHGVFMRECAVMSPISRVAAVDFLREKAKNFRSNANTKRIYISRRSASYRRVINEADLELILKRFGFQIFECESMRFDEQISLFKGAEIVCGPHGAGLTNIAFCQKGASVLEIAMDERVSIGLGAVFWELACAGDLDYHILSATRIPIDESNPHDGALYVEPKKFEAALDQVVRCRAGL